MNGHLFGQVPCRSRTDAGHQRAKPERAQGSESAHLDDRSHKACHSHRGTRIDVSHPEMERSRTGLKEECKHGQENTHAIKQATTSDYRRENVGRTGGTVNEGHAVQEDRAEDRARNEVLESTFVSIHVFAAKTHQGVNREAGQFHAQEESKEVDSLGHEQCTAGCKHQQSVGFATLELFVTESPLETCNSEECAEHHRETENATNRIHGIQVHEGVVGGQVVGTGTKG